MSDANEMDWSSKTGRKGGKPGMTRGASVSSGLGEHAQVNDSIGTNGHGTGQRPSKPTMGGSMSHGGRKFTQR